MIFGFDSESVIMTACKNNYFQAVHMGILVRKGFVVVVDFKAGSRNPNCISVK